jgi:hypothetical protein
MMTSPNATFSPAAAQAINAALQASATSSTTSQPQYVEPQPVPEPTTILAWALGLIAAARISRKRGVRLGR